MKKNRAALDELQLTHRRRARDYYKRSHRRLTSILVWVALILLFGVMGFSAVRVGRDMYSCVSSQQTSDELRETYYADVPDDADAATPTDITVPKDALEPPAAEQGALVLPAKPYPGSANPVMSGRFLRLRRENADIIAWLTIDGLLDEAVVQRDNSYYLRRDYRGYHNVNGSIFVDEGCSFRTRPYTVMLYGHNMRSGAMFGALRHYDKPSFYRANPFITFDTAYEDGRFVIFSVATVSLQHYDAHYLNFAKLNSSTVPWREEAIEVLKKHSLYSPVIDVSAEDQILLLVTCIDDEDHERRVIAARRIREGETEEALLHQISGSFPQ